LFPPLPTISRWWSQTTASKYAFEVENRHRDEVRAALQDGAVDGLEDPWVGGIGRGVEVGRDVDELRGVGDALVGTTPADRDRGRPADVAHRSGVPVLAAGMRAGKARRADPIAVEMRPRQTWPRVVDAGVLHDADDHAAAGVPLAVRPVRPDRVVGDVHRGRPAGWCPDLADVRVLGQGVNLSRRQAQVDHRRQVQGDDVGRAAPARIGDERSTVLDHELCLGPDQLLADGGQHLEIVTVGSIAVPLHFRMRGLDRLHRGAVVDGRQDVGEQRR
jgi:hypothetical protein